MDPSNYGGIKGNVPSTIHCGQVRGSVLEAGVLWSLHLSVRHTLLTRLPTRRCKIRVSGGGIRVRGRLGREAPEDSDVAGSGTCMEQGSVTGVRQL